MKKHCIFLVMLFVTIALAFSQVEDGTYCIILVSGRELSGVTSDIRYFNSTNRRLRFRVRNRLRSEDIEIISVEVVGKNARGDEIRRTFITNELDIEDSYDGIIPHRSDLITIYIRGLTLFRSLSVIIIYTDFI